MMNPSMVRLLALVFFCAVAVQGVSAHSEDGLLDQLRADYAALLDAKAEFEQAGTSGSIDSAEQADYAA